MIKTSLNNEILNDLLSVEEAKNALNLVNIPVNLSNQFRKNTKKKASYASNKIEGNPLTYEQAEEALSSTNRHFLKPEQEIRNYYLALEFLENKLKIKAPISLQLILDVQKIICNGESEDKIGLRGKMPPGFLFAVRNDDGSPAYIPPEYNEVPNLLSELIDYLNSSNDHPLIKAAVIHYEIVTIHPFEDGNGRTARIISSYYLSLNGYGFKNIGSLEEYISYDIEEYYSSLQMNLPILYYDGRNNPPHPEIRLSYFLKILKIYSAKVLAIALRETKENENQRLSHLSKKAQVFLKYLKKNKIEKFAPIDLANKLKVTNRTIINWAAELSLNGYLKPVLVNKRIRYYEVLL